MERVYVDGERVINKFSLGGGRYDLHVGESERHDVEIRVHGAFPPKINLLVDGELQARG